MKNQSTSYSFPVILLRLFGQRFMEFLTCRKKGLSRLWIIACCGGNTTEAVTKPSPFLLHGAFRKFVISWSLKADQRIQMELWVRLLVFFSDYFKPEKPSRTRSFRFPPSSLSANAGFFDGASQDGVCGGGAIIFLQDNVSYYIWLNAGKGTNTKAEIVVAWALLFFAASLKIPPCKCSGTQNVRSTGWQVRASWMSSL